MRAPCLAPLKRGGRERTYPHTHKLTYTPLIRAIRIIPRWRDCKGRRRPLLRRPEEAATIHPADLRIVPDANRDHVVARLHQRSHVEIEVVRVHPPELVRLVAGVAAVDPDPTLVDRAAAPEVNRLALELGGHI